MIKTSNEYGEVIYIKLENVCQITKKGSGKFLIMYNNGEIGWVHSETFEKLINQ